MVGMRRYFETLTRFVLFLLSLSLKRKKKACLVSTHATLKVYVRVMSVTAAATLRSSSLQRCFIVSTQC